MGIIRSTVLDGRYFMGIFAKAIPLHTCPAPRKLREGWDPSSSSHDLPHRAQCLVPCSHDRSCGVAGWARCGDENRHLSPASLAKYVRSSRVAVGEGSHWVDTAPRACLGGTAACWDEEGHPPVRTAQGPSVGQGGASCPLGTVSCLCHHIDLSRPAASDNQDWRRPEI